MYFPLGLATFSTSTSITSGLVWVLVTIHSCSGVSSREPTRGSFHGSVWEYSPCRVISGVVFLVIMLVLKLVVEWVAIERKVISSAKA